MVEDIRRLKQLSVDEESVNEGVASSAKCVSVHYFSLANVI